jgi:hypothetical protein
MLPLCHLHVGDRCALLMMDFKLFIHSVDSVVYEVHALVAHQNSWASKSSDHLFK